MLPSSSDESCSGWHTLRLPHVIVKGDKTFLDFILVLKVIIMRILSRFFVIDLGLMFVCCESLIDF